MGSPSLFLGIETVSLSDGLLLSQRRYMGDILKRAGMIDCKPVATPVSLASGRGTSVSYSYSAGLVICGKPALSAHAYSHHGALGDAKAGVTVIRYVKGTSDLGLLVRRSVSTDIHAFSDSDWAGNPTDRKSTSGFAVYLGGNLVSWSCRKQRTVARSSTEAEYKALADVSAEVTWLVSLLREIGLSPVSPPKLWCDNLGATYLCANPVFHARTKHVEIDYHFVRDKVSKKEIQVHFISTKDQLADIFTKALPSTLFRFLRGKLNVAAGPP
ncbi:PREDICTED: uncharacterized protein LOC109181279 [Ipomoea nil]|uniref:uncharacterized protein LOC109181279 n=1 Tax=Ipomoea nil TaxID=35883 RepID=UPI000901C1CA|nr:PREDICTED: uncharacterized protein LOC109181279 [Ipomoea nil]